MDGLHELSKKSARLIHSYYLIFKRVQSRFGKMRDVSNQLNVKISVTHLAYGLLIKDV